MAVEGVILEKATVEKDIVLKRRQRSPSAESPNPPSSYETPRASSASTPKSSVPSSVRSTPAREKPSKYVSKMAKAREEKKRKEAAAAPPNSTNSEKSMMSSELETSGSIPSTESGTLSEKSQANVDKLGILPKFGEWNKHSANSGPCYTLLFQNAAQEKKIGGPIRVHGARTMDASVPNQDLYGYNKSAPAIKPKKLKKSGGLLCCFKTSES